MKEKEQQKNTKISLKLWFRVLQYTLKRKKFFIVALTATVLTAIVDIVYPLMSKFAIDSFIENNTLEHFGWFVAAYVGLIIIQSIGVASFVIFGSKMEITTTFNLRSDMFFKLQQLSFSYYDKTPAGHIIARVISDVSGIGEVIVWGVLNILWPSVYIIGVLITMFILDAQLALLVCLIIPLLVFACSFFGKKMLKHQRNVRKHNSNITSSYNECIMGAVTTKTLVREKRNEEEFFAETRAMKKATMGFATVQFIFMPLVLTLGSLGTAIALYKGGIDVMNGIVTYGTLSVFLSSMSMLFESIQQISECFAELQSTQASAERVFELLDTPVEITDSDEIIAKYGDFFNPKLENFPKIHGDIEFSHVDFAYNGGEKVLTDFNLTVKSGQAIALVGETGAGKSTIVNLLCRFYEPVSGEIRIDGEEYRTKSQVWLQSNLGYVLQQPHLFSGSIRDNITFGMRNATEEQIINAAKTVHAHDFIMQLKDGYDSEVGEGGSLLSTGQKQLISFARVVLANPAIFVLDEATSSIDTETEQVIQSAIVNVLKGRTSFIVAHRLSTIRNADRILVIRNGKITEDGTHEQLMALGGYYHDLYTNQFKEESYKAAMN